MDQKQQLLLDTTRRLIRRGAFPNLAKVLAKSHPADIAALFRYLDLREQRLLFNLIEDPEKSAYVLSELDHATGAQLLEQLDKETITEVLQEMPYDDAVDIIQNMPEEVAEELLSIMHIETSEEIEQLLQYGEDTAGGIMATEFFALGEDVTVREAIAALQQAKDLEMVFYLYVINDQQQLVGVLSLRQLLTVPPDTRLGRIMTTEVISVGTAMDQEDSRWRATTCWRCRSSTTTTGWSGSSRSMTSSTSSARRPPRTCTRWPVPARRSCSMVTAR